MAPVAAAEISRHDLAEFLGSPTASITDVKHLSSYNWVEAVAPTIAVPGSPPRWSAPSTPRKLKKDSGLVYIAQNAARHPKSPLEPLFRALYITDPTFDIRSVDIVTDRNNIRKLLSFIQPNAHRNRLEAFTIGVEFAENTALFCREETATHEFIRPHEFKGFGHEFEKAYTTSQIRDSTGHHRILSYRFGGLNFLVRHETDGYVHIDTNIVSHKSRNSEDDPLASMLESLSLSTASPTTTGIETGLAIREEGQDVPIESTLEIKTRVAHKPLAIQEIAPQLWISQTPKLVRAYHRNGTFSVPKVEDVTTEIRRWEQRNEKDLKTLVALINKLLDLVKDCGGKAFVQFDEKKDVLLVRKDDGKKMLPQDLYSKWDGGDVSI